MTSGKPAIDLIGPARCTGCFACASACARDALEISLDSDGFYKPVVIRDACNDCGLCSTRCPVVPDPAAAPSAGLLEKPSAFAAWANDESLRLASSSGGIFSLLARPVIEASGSVVGCTWGAGWQPEHVVARDWAAVEPMRGSKYVPSRVGDSYHRVLAALREDPAPVLFTGTPCQVAAMERALNPRQRERVLLVEFLCHGVPSLRAFHAYLSELFDGERVARYTFRDKSLGWQTVVAESATGRHYRRLLSDDPFGRALVLENLILMEACYDCAFLGYPRAGDVTLGDFWGCPEKWHDRRGVSLVLANTVAGVGALGRLRETGVITLEEADLAVATRNNRCGPGKVYAVPRARRRVLDGLAKGESFRTLFEAALPGRWTLLWRSFLSSHSRPAFVLDILRDRARRILGRAR